EAGPDEFWMTRQREHHVNAEQARRYRTGRISILRDQVRRWILVQCRHGGLDGDEVLGLIRDRLSVAFHHLPGRLELHDSGREGQELLYGVARVRLKAWCRLQPVRLDEVGEGLVHM